MKTRPPSCTVRGGQTKPPAQLHQASLGTAPLAPHPITSQGIAYPSLMKMLR